MKIALLAHNLRAGGGLSVAKDIFRTLLDVAPMHQYLMIVPEGKSYSEFSENENVQLLECPVSLRKRFFWERKELRRAIKTFSPDWLWALGNLPFSNLNLRQSLLFQNAHYLNYRPTWFWQSTRNPFYYLYVWCRYQVRTRSARFQIRRSVNNLDRIYCQTATICQRFAEHYKCDISKTGVFRTPFSPNVKRLGTNAALDSQIIPETIQKQYASRFKLFYPSLPLPHKNMEKIVLMYKHHRDQLSSTLCILPVDPRGSGKEQRLARMIKQYQVEDFFWLTGHIPLESISQYYHFSDAVFFPSLLETIGLGHLEGMYCHRPVIASDADFARDVCGDAAYYVDPYSTTSMKDGILALQNDPDLYKSLVQKGQTHYQNFQGTWEQAIKDVLDQEKIEHL